MSCYGEVPAALYWSSRLRILTEKTMTPEELNRAMEFIIESQGRLAAAQERDGQDRIEFQE